VAYPLNGLANLYRDQGKYEQAQSLYQRAFTIRQHRLGPEHPNTAESLHDMACFYHVQGQTAEALSLYQQALVLRERVLGPNHPETVKTRTAYADLLQETGDVD
jgi:tetratricopeptide (TPR) repeat protein